MSSLGKNLYLLVEHHQTEALISPKVKKLGRDAVLRAAVRSFVHHREAARRLGQFIRERNLAERRAGR